MASTIKADTLQSTTSNVFVLNSAGTEYARFNSSGNLQLAGAFSANGNVTLSAANTKILNSSGNPILQQTGSVLQVVNVSTSLSVSTTSATMADTGLTLSITPTATTSKILIIVNHFYSFDSTMASAGFQMLRGATNIGNWVNYLGYSNAATFYNIYAPWTYLDSPSTTSATTYKTQYNRSNGSGTVYLNLNSPLHSMTLMEIAG